MRIYSLSKILILPLVIAAIGIFYYAESSGNEDVTIWLILPTILLAIVLIFYGHIDFWWHKRHPIPVDRKIIQWLERFFPFYQQLDREGRSKFEYRLSLYMEGREFKSIGSEVREVPEDIKGIISSLAVMLTMNQKDFLLGDYDRIYLYKHPFPTPHHQYLHSVEVNHEDGLILFALEYLLPGITREKEFYNIGIHAFAEAYIKVFQPQLPDPKSISWEKIQQISHYRKEDVLSTTGMKDLNMQAVLITCYFTNPVKMKSGDDDLYHLIEKIF